MMSKIKMASPLYILRNDCENDLAGVLEKLGQIGFDGVEFLGFFGHSAQSVHKMLADNGLLALGNHVPYAQLAENAEAVLDFHQAVGCAYLTVAELPLAHFQQIAQSLDCIAQKALARGIRLLYHNHDHELMACNRNPQPLGRAKTVFAPMPNLGGGPRQSL